MNRPGYLVEGDLEQKFIQNVCPGCPVRKINCNGKTTSIQAIAKRVGTLGRLLHKTCSPLIIVLDRENREQSSEQMEKELGAAIEQEKIDVPVVLGIPDRNIESWILADNEMLFQVAGIVTKTVPPFCEGKNGKSLIKHALCGGRTYVETIDGVQWLKAARPAVMQKNSPSFSRFFSALSELDCRWLKQLELPLTANQCHGGTADPSAADPRATGL